MGDPWWDQGTSLQGKSTHRDDAWTTSMPTARFPEQQQPGLMETLPLQPQPQDWAPPGCGHYYGYYLLLFPPFPAAGHSSEGWEGVGRDGKG